MRSSGLVRKIDDLGRIVLPAEIRRALGIRTHDALEIGMEGDCIVLHKHEPACVLCHKTGDTIVYCEKLVCKECIRKLKAY